tara:strand:+ start:266 stop:748 length:483 start_codon:yes stop_codon:yes gene_type:complete
MAMVKISKKIKLNKPIKDVWKVLYGGFTDVGNWVTGVYASRPGTKEEDSDRVCDTALGKLYEKITFKDEKNHEYRVEVTKNPFFIDKFSGRWKLNKLTDTSTEAEFEITVTFKGIIGMIMQFPTKFKLKSAISEIVGDLTTFVETGEISKTKQEEVNKKK